MVDVEETSHTVEWTIPPCMECHACMLGVVEMMRQGCGIDAWVAKAKQSKPMIAI